MGVLIFSLFSWEPQIEGQSKRTGGSCRFTPKSAPLGHKSGMSHGALHRALLPISLVFYRTGLVVKHYHNYDPWTGQCPPSSKGYCGHSVSQKKIRHVFFNSGDQTCPRFLKYILGASLMVQWLRHCAPNAGGLGLIRGQGSRPYMPQLRVQSLQQRPTKTNKY